MIRSLKKNITLDFVMCLLLIVASGNPIFIYSTYVRELYIILVILSFLYSNKRNIYIAKDYISYISVFIIVFLLQLLSVDDIAVNSQIFQLLRMFVGLAIIKSLGAKFQYIYVKVITIVAVISLFLFTYTNLVGYIPAFISFKSSHSLIIYTEIYEDYWGVIPRNAGMFWEPGAFQGYLNLAILFALMMPKSTTRKYSLIFLIVALLTTVSTTGYVVFGFVIIYYIYKYSKFNKSIRFLLTLIVCIAAVCAFFELSFLHDKIIDNLSDVDSSQGRITDFIRYRTYIKENWICGMNVGRIPEFITGNGLVYMTLSFGFPAMIYYLLYTLLKLKKNNNFSLSMYMFVFILLTIQGETFNFYPLYLGLPFLKLQFTEELSF
ncbi:MAG: hypothetical protein J6S05_03580 [Bacteroidaceae bacterium]|nr:hypothetical protein [Bacteroidaceae bacterium]